MADTVQAATATPAESAPAPVTAPVAPVTVKSGEPKRTVIRVNTRGAAPVVATAPAAAAKPEEAKPATEKPADAVPAPATAATVLPPAADAAKADAPKSEAAKPVEPAKPAATPADDAAAKLKADMDARFAALAQREKMVNDKRRREAEALERERAEFQRERDAWKAEREAAQAAANASKTQRQPPKDAAEAQRYELEDMRAAVEEAHKRYEELEKRLAADRETATKREHESAEQARQRSVAQFTDNVAKHLETSGEKYKHAHAFNCAKDVVATVQAAAAEIEREYGREEAARILTGAKIQELVDKAAEFYETDYRNRVKGLIPAPASPPVSAAPSQPANGEAAPKAVEVQPPVTAKPEVAQSPRTIDKSLTARTGTPTPRAFKRTKAERMAASEAIAAAVRARK